LALFVVLYGIGYMTSWRQSMPEQVGFWTELSGLSEQRVRTMSAAAARGYYDGLMKIHDSESVQ
jgi:hypothetical protein